MDLLESKLASASEMLRQNVNIFPALQTLGASLSDEQNTRLQAEAARLLANFTRCEHQEHHIPMRRRRSSESSSLEMWASMEHMDKETCLCNFECCAKLLQVPKILHDLANSLSKHDNPDLQVEAARVLYNIYISRLSLFGDSSDEVYPLWLDNGTLDTLVAILFVERNPLLQEEAAKLLAISIHHEFYQVRRKDGSSLWFSEVLQELANSLSKRENSDLQVESVSLRVFSNMARLLPDDIPAECCLFLVDDGLLDTLLVMLTDEQNVRLQAEAVRLLATITDPRNTFIDNQVCGKVLWFPAVKESLANVLSKNENPCPDLQAEAAALLSNMSAGLHYISCGNLFQFLVDKGILETLAASLSNKQYPHLQAEAARLLATMTDPKNNFAVDNQFCKEILRLPGIKEELANALSDLENPNLQVEAAVVFSNMSGLLDKVSREEIYRFLVDVGTLNMLVASLSDEQNLHLRLQAARLLADMTRWKNDEKLFNLLASNLHGVLKTSAALLSDAANPDFWLEAVTLLSFVTSLKENDICSEILQFPEIMEKLASLLSHDNQDLQLEAARVFSNMSGLSDDESRVTVFKLLVSNLRLKLGTLAKSLSNGNNPDRHDQWEAARMLLQYFDAGGPDNRLRAARLHSNRYNSDRRLEAARLLSNRYNSDRRLEAARLLSYITSSKDFEFTREILLFCGIMNKLTSLLSKREDPDLQVEAVRVLSNMLGLPEAEDRRKLLTSGMLSSVVAIATEGKDLRPQVEAARLLANITNARNYELCNQILSALGTLEKLTSLLSKHDHEDSDLPVVAARALFNMLESSDDGFCGKYSYLRGVVDTVVALLTDEKCPRLQVEAARLLSSIARSKNHKFCSKDHWPWFSGHRIMEQLANSLSQGKNSDLQLEATRVLCDMSRIPDKKFREELFHFLVFGHSGMLNTLVASLCNPGLQVETARLLANITRWKNHDFCSEILRFPGMMQNLTSSLSNHENIDLQVEAATVFCNVSGLSDDGCSVEPSNNQSVTVLEILKNSLFQVEDGPLKMEAVRLLARINPFNNYEFCIKLFWFPGMMEKLADSFSNHQNPDLQVEAAKVFCNMSQLPDDESLWKLFNLQGVLDTLVASLSDGQHCGLQAEAVRLLANVARSRNYELCIKILRFPRIMEKLVGSLSKHGNSDLQMDVAAVFRIMSGMPDDEIRWEILNFPGMLDTLVALLSDEQSSCIQGEAARLLANITSSKSFKLCSKVLRFPGMMWALEGLLSQDQKPDLQVEAARVVCNMSEFLDGVTFNFQFSEKLGLLSQNDHPFLRVEATKAFASLSGWTTSVLRQKLRSYYTARMEMLERLLSGYQGSDRWLEAARLLRSLSGLKDDVMQGKIAYFNNGNVLEKLLGVLSLDQNPDLQVEVAGVFSNLLNFPNGGPPKQAGELVMKKLVTFLSQSQNPEVQLSVTRMFASLSALEDAAFWRKLLSFGLLESLASALSRMSTGYPSLQLNGATVFANVSALEDDLLSEEILKLPDVLEKLTGLLSENGNPLLQVAGARTLANFTCTKSDTIRAMLVHFPGLMIKVANTFIQQGSRLAQVEAARAFVNLTYMKVEILHERYVRVPDLLKSLARSSMQSSKANVQGQGAGENEDPSCTEDDAVGDEKFARSACSGEIYALEAEAASVLINWAISEDDSFMGGQILCSRGLLVWAGAESKAAGSKRGSELIDLTPQLRSDIQSLGLTTWDRLYNPREIYGLYNVRADKKGIDFMFFHARGMAKLYGVGLHHGIVSIIRGPELQITVEEIEHKRWKDAWVDSYRGSFKPIVFQMVEESSSGSDNHDALAKKGALEFSTLGEIESPIGSGLLYKGWVEDFIHSLQHGDGFGNDEGVDEAGDDHGDGRENDDESDGSKSHQDNGRDHHQGECRDVQGGSAGNGQGSENGKDKDGGDRSGDSGKGQGGSGDRGDPGNDDGNDRRNPLPGQSNGKVVVSVTLLRTSTYFETYEDCMEHKVNLDIQGKIINEICGMPTANSRGTCATDNRTLATDACDTVTTDFCCLSVTDARGTSSVDARAPFTVEARATSTTDVRGVSTIVPRLNIEFTWECLWQKIVTINFGVDYGISDTHKDDCGWYQDHLQMSFSCSEDPVKQRAIKICPDEVLSETTDVAIERTDAHGQSNNSGTAYSATPGIGFGSTAVKGQLGKQSTKGTTSEVKDVWSRSERRLVDSGFRLFRKGDASNPHNLRWEAVYPGSIEPARHWEERKWNDVRGTGLYTNVPVAVRGNWELKTDDDEEEVKFKFEATKQLQKWTKPSDKQKGKSKQLLRPVIKIFSPEKGNVLNSLGEPEIRQVWQKLIRELILDHNFLKGGLEGFNRLKHPATYGIQDPVSKVCVNPIEEVVSQILNKYYPGCYVVGGASSVKGRKRYVNDRNRKSTAR